jgi:hypothetical protein
MIILAAMVVIGVMALRFTRRSRQHALGSPGRADGPARLMASAIALLPADRGDWGQAMAGELEQLGSPRDRWRFAVGCLWGALLFPKPGGRARPVVAATVAGAAACAVAVAYALAAYPGLLTHTGTWVSVVLFAVILTFCVLVTTVSARQSPTPTLALVGGAGIAVVWVLAGTVAGRNSPQPAYALPLLLLPISALIAGIVATRTGGTTAAGRRTALLTAVTTGLTLFLILAGVTFATATHPHDPAITRGLPASGFHDLSTYYISDNLGTAMALLLLSTTVIAALGCLSATLTPAPSAPGTGKPASGRLP